MAHNGTNVYEVHQIIYSRAEVIGRTKESLQMDGDYTIICRAFDGR